MTLGRVDTDGLVLDPNFFDGSNCLGLWITILAGVCSNLGVQLQKQAHHSQSKGHTAYYVQKQWVVGMVLVIVGSIGDFEALRCVHRIGACCLIPVN